jgi:hypothetical protein
VTRARSGEGERRPHAHCQHGRLRVGVRDREAEPAFGVDLFEVGLEVKRQGEAHGHGAEPECHHAERGAALGIRAQTQDWRCEADCVQCEQQGFVAGEGRHGRPGCGKTRPKR